MNRVLWPLGILLLVGMVVGAGWALNHTAPPAGAVGNDGDKSPAEVFCLGMIDVEDGIAELYPKQPGVVAEIAETRVKEKDGTERERLFKKGEVILRLKSEMAEWTRDKAKAAVRAAEAELDKAKKLPAEHKLKLGQQQAVISASKHEKAKLEADLDNKKRMYKENIGNINKDVLKAMEEAVATADARIRAEQLKLDELSLFEPDLEVRRAAADLDAKKLDVKIAEQAVEDFRVAAPFDGYVLRLHTRVGEVRIPDPRAPAVEFCPDVKRIVRAEVMQEWGHKVHVGQSATIEDDTYQGPHWEGRIIRLSDWYAPKRLKIIEPFMTNDVRTMDCIVAITGGQSPVRIGQRVRVRIKI